MEDDEQVGRTQWISPNPVYGWQIMNINKPMDQTYPCVWVADDEQLGPHGSDLPKCMYR